MTIGEAVYRTRIEEGITQQSLSIMAQISERYVNYIEREKKIPTLKVLKRIAHAFDRDMFIVYRVGHQILNLRFEIRSVLRTKTYTDLVCSEEIQNRLYVDSLKLCRYNIDNAKNVVQEVTAQALMYEHRFNAQTCQLYTWLWGIAKNVYYQDKHEQRFLIYAEDYIESDILAIDSHNNVILPLKLYNYINGLTEGNRKIYKMRLANYSYDEIGEAMNNKPDNVKQVYWHIKRRLKDIIINTKKANHENIKTLLVKI